MPKIPKGNNVFTLSKSDQGKTVWTMTMVAAQDLEVSEKDFDEARTLSQKFLDEVAELI